MELELICCLSICERWKKTGAWKKTVQRGEKNAIEGWSIAINSSFAMMRKEFGSESFFVLILPFGIVTQL